MVVYKYMIRGYEAQG